MSPEQTTPISDLHTCLHKEDFLSRFPIFLNRTVVNTVYSPETALASLHIHDFVEISIVTEGKGIHYTLSQLNECHPGDVYIINKGTPHAYFATPEGDRPTVCNLIFDPETSLENEYAQSDHPKYCYGIFRKNSLAEYIMLASGSMSEVMNILANIEKELTQQKFEWKEALKANFINFLIVASRYISPQKQIPANVTSKEHLLALSIMRTVLAQYSDPELTLSKIAKALYVSMSTAGRVFFSETGEHFSDYLRRVRLEKAGQLLAETALTNEQIVYACGLRDVPCFYRMFKKSFGVTPYAYRKNADKKTQIPSIKQNIKPNNSNIGEKSMSILMEISENLQKGKAKVVAELVQNALNEGIPAQDILNQGLLHCISIVGEKFKNNEVYVPEVLVAARAMNKGTDILKPHLIASGVKAVGKVCIGTVQGDLHDIGKNLVKMMLEGKGLEVIDLGTDVSPETFVTTAIEQNCQVICCSSLLTTTMGVMEDVVKKAIELGVRDKVKIMVGGAPVSKEFCAKIGADIYTPDAASAADAAVEFCKAGQ